MSCTALQSFVGHVTDFSYIPRNRTVQLAWAAPVAVKDDVVLHSRSPGGRSAKELEAMKEIYKNIDDVSAKELADNMMRSMGDTYKKNEDTKWNAWLGKPRIPFW